MIRSHHTPTKLWFGFLISLFLFLGCQQKLPDYQIVAQDFIQTYYLQINPKKALELTEGPAAEKMRRELELLHGIPPSQLTERPQLKFQINSCRAESDSKATCDYELDIQAERSFKRRGRLTLRQQQGHWRVTQFTEVNED